MMPYQLGENKGDQHSHMVEENQNQAYPNELLGSTAQYEVPGDQVLSNGVYELPSQHHL